ncbi:hypothetical protein GWI33_006485 [Rhynchophorus ferrugineus]|uniref:Uncharacterized protein n=1 Tax=Rhynchophorus ferrugineus TaxID=354439 RepID=A0A834IJ01_RHYFE|nr:hypothetical protein GWI33_006485 [Rhynchophorus ferrugineus]
MIHSHLFILWISDAADSNRTSERARETEVDSRDADVEKQQIVEGRRWDSIPLAQNRQKRTSQWHPGACERLKWCIGGEFSSRQMRGGLSANSGGALTI